jgi:hypothetical protein
MREKLHTTAMLLLARATADRIDDQWLADARSYLQDEHKRSTAIANVPACAITDDETEEWRVDELDPENAAPWVTDWTGANEGTANKVMGMVMAGSPGVEMVRKVRTTSKACTMGVLKREPTDG